MASVRGMRRNGLEQASGDLVMAAGPAEACVEWVRDRPDGIERGEA